MKKLFSAVVLAAIFGFSGASYSQESTTVDTYKLLNDFGIVFDTIKKQYVDVKSDSELIDAAIAGMFKQLDPHSTYLSPSMRKQLQQDSEGQLSGIGAHVSQDPTSKEIIVKPMPDSPAKNAGLKSGDHIVFVDGNDVREMDIQTAVELITGPVGSTVVLKIRRPNQEELEEISIVRAVVNSPFIWSRVINKDGKNIFYIKMISFNMRSAKEVSERIDAMKLAIGGEEKIDGLIFDVRFDPGGLLVSAVALSNMFMDKGLIVETRGRSEAPQQAFATEKTIIPMSVPMVVLINPYSASASEILSGTLGQSGRAMIIGEKSYGKGSVQTTMPLPSGGAMKLTIAKYYTNGGTTPHGVGIIPMIEVKMPENYWKDHNFIEDNDSMDPQLEKAIEWLICAECTTEYYKARAAEKAKN